MMLQVQGESVSDDPQNQGLLDEHWEVEAPRRTMRFLASVLILISIMQVQYSIKPFLFTTVVLSDASGIDDKMGPFSRMRQKNGMFFCQEEWHVVLFVNVSRALVYT